MPIQATPGSEGRAPHHRGHWCRAGWGLCGMAEQQQPPRLCPLPADVLDQRRRWRWRMVVRCRADLAEVRRAPTLFPATPSELRPFADRAGVELGQRGPHARTAKPRCSPRPSACSSADGWAREGPWTLHAMNVKGLPEGCRHADRLFELRALSVAPLGPPPSGGRASGLDKTGGWSSIEMTTDRTP